MVKFERLGKRELAQYNDGDECNQNKESGRNTAGQTAPDPNLSI